MLEKRVTVRFNAEEFALIERYAKREGFTVSLLLRRSMLQTMRRLGVLPPAGDYDGGRHEEDETAGA